jgi:CheY-like chemotaxis protein
MPRTSGPELASRLQKISPGLKVVFMSGYSDDIRLRRGLQAGDDNFIMKPFSPDELAGKVREELGPQVPMTRILVADDQAEVRSFIRAALESEDYVVAEAADGKQAMRHARSEPVDLVITDLVMPEQEGIETIRALRLELPDVRIIATSGAFNGQFLGMAKLLGADGALSKPFSLEALLAKVEEVLSAKRRPVGPRG